MPGQWEVYPLPAATCSRIALGTIDRWKVFQFGYKFLPVAMVASGIGLNVDMHAVLSLCMRAPSPTPLLRFLPSKAKDGVSTACFRRDPFTRVVRAQPLFFPLPLNPPYPHPTSTHPNHETQGSRDCVSIPVQSLAVAPS